jgi:hypothetical protein
MFKKKFSLPHWDEYEDNNLFYTLFKNSSPRYKEEVRDIYFGAEFKYTYNGVDKRYGEVMGVTASEEQEDNLFKIQEEFGIDISLTLNSLDVPPELSKDRRVIDEFVEFIRGYYDRGLRTCTIGATHLMRIGILQDTFPEMRWKNTVNHKVSTTQEMYDYAALGYTTILLDRSLNRDMETLKEVCAEAKKIGVETSLLASEACMPSCPFKEEHDNWQAELYKSEASYWQTYTDTCVSWRTPETTQLPRLGTNISMATKEIADMFFDTVDVIKFSGRLGVSYNVDPNGRMCWSGMEKGRGVVKMSNEILFNTFEYADSFGEVYDKGLAPYLVDRWAPQSWTNLTHTQQHSEEDINSIWLTKKGKSLSRVLTKCKNKCWDCHACEKVFGVEKFNTVIAL